MRPHRLHRRHQRPAPGGDADDIRTHERHVQVSPRCNPQRTGRIAGASSVDNDDIGKAERLLQDVLKSRVHTLRHHHDGPDNLATMGLLQQSGDACLRQTQLLGNLLLGQSSLHIHAGHPAKESQMEHRRSRLKRCGHGVIVGTEDVDEGSSMLIGIDWGGTKIEGVALEPDGTELLRIREATPRGDYDGCLALVRGIVQRLEDATGRTGSVGIGIPGSLEPESRIGKGGSSTWINGQAVEQDLLRVLERPLRVENDADCFAASEATDGAGVGHRVVFGVIIASGTGAGIAIDGRPHHGPNNSAGDWGHNPLPFATQDELPGEPCYCGKSGCMETWLSGYSFAREYERLTGHDSLPAQIMDQRRSGDHDADLVYRSWLDRAARGLSVVVNTVDPDIFVLGGGMSNIDEVYSDLPLLIGSYTFSPVFTTPIVRSVHGDSSGVRGAAWLWKETT